MPIGNLLRLPRLTAVREARSSSGVPGAATDKLASADEPGASPPIARPGVAEEVERSLWLLIAEAESGGELPVGSRWKEELRGPAGTISGRCHRRG